MVQVTLFNMSYQEAFKRFKNYKTIKQPIKGRGVFTLWVADTDTKKRLGLSRLKKLPKKHGMIFVYDKDVLNPFTMKNTMIPLTIIFLDENFNIIDTFHCNANSSKSVVPSKKYRYVIEI